QGRWRRSGDHRTARQRARSEEGRARREGKREALETVRQGKEKRRGRITSPQRQKDTKKAGIKSLGCRPSLCLFAFVVLSGCVKSDDQVTPAVHAVLESQQAAWNRGDIDGFMDGY